MPITVTKIMYWNAWDPEAHKVTGSVYSDKTIKRINQQCLGPANKFCQGHKLMYQCVAQSKNAMSSALCSRAEGHSDKLKLLQSNQGTIADYFSNAYNWLLP